MFIKSVIVVIVGRVSGKIICYKILNLFVLLILVDLIKFEGSDFI